MRCAAWVLLVGVCAAPAAARDPAPTEPSACVAALLETPDAKLAAAQARVRKLGVRALPWLTRALAAHASEPRHVRRLRRAVTLITEDWHRAKTPPGMVYVPAGPLELPRERRPYGPRGKREVVPAFYLDRHETTIDQWRAWCDVLERDGPASPRWVGPPIAADADGRLPVSNISYEAARRYAREHRQGRLPRAEEFERAVRGSGLRTYPWGETLEPARANLDWGLGPRRPVPVGSHPTGAGPFGALDLVGNVAEWSATTVPYGTVGKRGLVLGGSFQDPPDRALTWRGETRPRIQSARSRWPHIGFRVARDVPELPPQ